MKKHPVREIVKAKLEPNITPKHQIMENQDKLITALIIKMTSYKYHPQKIRVSHNSLPRRSQIFT